VKDAVIVPETKPIETVLADLQRESGYVAVVIDEYGPHPGHRGAGEDITRR